jgi:hypothetical protein
MVIAVIDQRPAGCVPAYDAVTDASGPPHDGPSGSSPSRRSKIARNQGAALAVVAVLLAIWFAG